MLLARAAPARAAPVRSHKADAACRDEHDNCKQWAENDECTKNPGFMGQQCARSCDTCGWVDPVCGGAGRPAKGNGGINAVFEAAAARPELRATVHSRPPEGPWVMTFDSFVTTEEADAFIDTTQGHFDRSLAGDMISPVRTSRQAWCQPGIATDCYKHPLIQRVQRRVANVTGVPPTNAEFYQVLRYEPGQFYKRHHDQNAGAGVRRTPLPLPRSSSSAAPSSSSASSSSSCFSTFH